MASAVLEPVRPLVKSIVDPVDGVRAAVEQRRWLAPMLFTMAALSLAAVAVYLRYDAGPSTVRMLEMTGEMKATTEQELRDKIETARNVVLVAGVAKAVFVTPLLLLGMAVALKFTGWLLGVKSKFSKVFTAASLAMLPAAVGALVLAGCALAQPSITELPPTSLVPSSLAAFIHPASTKVGSVLKALDFFNLWGAVVLGLGFSQASDMRRGRAVLLGVVLYAMWAGVTMIGLPAMMMGGGHP